MYPSGMKGPTSGLSQQAGEAEGSLTLEAQGRTGSSPDNDGTGRHRQTTWVRQATTERRNASEPAVEPPQGGNRLRSGGYGPGSSARRLQRFAGGDSEAGVVRRW